MSNKIFKYKNNSSEKQNLVGFGMVEPGKTIETNEPVHNPNFVIVGSGRMVNVESPVEQPKVNTIKSKE